MTTKEQERKALAEIRRIVEGLGEGSYLAAAFEGCFEIAQENIDNDWCCSMKQRAELAEAKEKNALHLAEEKAQSGKTLADALQAAYDEINRLHKRLDEEKGNQTQAVQTVYDEMIEEMAELNRHYVETNHAMRSLELAKRQVESKGDIKIDYALKLLSDHYDSVARRNKDTADKLYAKRDFVARFRRRIRELSGYDVDGGGDKIREVFGY